MCAQITPSYIFASDSKLGGAEVEHFLHELDLFRDLPRGIALQNTV